MARAARPARASPARTTTRPPARDPGPRPAVRTSTAPRPGSPFSSTSRNARRGMAASTSSSVGTPCAASSSGPRSATRRATPWTRSSVSSWMHDRHAVPRSADVELEAVAARDVERGEERGDRVLGRAPPVAAVRESEGRQGSSRPPRSTSSRDEPEVIARVQRRVADRRPVEREARATRRGSRRGPRRSRGSRARRRCPSPAPGAPTATSPRVRRRSPRRTPTGSRPTGSARRRARSARR